MMQIAHRYYHWLHGQWPAGTIEKLPVVGEAGATNIAGMRIAGDLTGIPLLKFSADSGARAVQAIVAEAGFRPGGGGADVLDLAIIGGGVAGFAAAKEARKAGLHFAVFEAQEPFATIANFPKGKPIYTYPTEMTPAGELQLAATVKEDLLSELHRQTDDIPCRPERVEAIGRRGDLLQVAVAGGETIAAQRVLVAIGRSGNYRALGVPGQDLDKVYNRLHDPKDFTGQDVLVVGGGDSALEAAIALTHAGARVILSYRQREFARAKPANVEQIEHLRALSGSDHAAAPGDGELRLLMGSRLERIETKAVRLTAADGEAQSFPNDVVFALIGREPPLDFFRRSGLAIAGERN